MDNLAKNFHICNIFFVYLQGQVTDLNVYNTYL